MIRPARREDLPGLLALYAQLNPGEDPPAPGRATAAMEALLAPGQARLLVADIGAGPVACCTLVVVPNLTRGARPFAMIENVVTDAGHRRQGIGRALLRAALAEAWAENCYKVMLATGSRQGSTLSFYEGAGFRAGKTHFEVRRDAGSRDKFVAE